MIKAVWISIVFLTYAIPLNAVSIVYNFKTAQITRHQFFKADYNRRAGLLLLSIFAKDMMERVKTL